MNSKLVSIIIPVYNSKRYILETLESVFNQTYTNLEIILIDDGSTDGIDQLFPSFEEHGVKCFKQPNKGASTARNLGLTNATGEFIQFLDADDVLHPDKIEMQVRKMEEDDSDISFTFWVNFEETVENTMPFKFPSMNFSSIRDGKDVLKTFGMEGFFVLPLAWLTRRDLIIKAGYWNPYINTNDDAEYFSRVLMWSQKLSIIKKVLAYYRKSQDLTLSNVNSEARAISAFYSWKLIHSLMLSSGDRELLSYPKKGYYHFFYVTKRKYSKISAQIANEFNKLDAPYYGSKGIAYWIVKNFGLIKYDQLIRIKKEFHKMLNRLQIFKRK